MTLADYSLIAGITGDTFITSFIHWRRSFKGDSASSFYLGIHGYTDVFDKLGYAAESFSEREFQSNVNDYIKKKLPIVLTGDPCYM